MSVLMVYYHFCIPNFYVNPYSSQGNWIKLAFFQGPFGSNLLDIVTLILPESWLTGETTFF
jgi:hypothetical protein